MDVSLEPGRYVIAVSGGVDSVVLMHALQQDPKLDLIVAHFDHGIRPNSAADREFVDNLAKRHGLKFEAAEGRLGPSASEATARAARYEFLESMRLKHAAGAIVTAHHQDDLIETAIINMLRGTGPKGLAALSDHPGLRRPLLNIRKAELVDYATKQRLVWQEDETNQDYKYLRNYVRHSIIPKLDEEGRAQLLSVINKSRQTNYELDTLLVKYIQPDLKLGQFRLLPHSAAREVMAAWLRHHGIRDFDKKTIERLVVAAKVAPAGSRSDIRRGTSLSIERQTASVIRQPSGKKAERGYNR